MIGSYEKDRLYRHSRRLEKTPGIGKKKDDQIRISLSSKE
jgi:hypothetical protein